MDMLIFHETADTKVAECIKHSAQQFKVENVVVDQVSAKFFNEKDLRTWLHKKAVNTRCFILMVGNNFMQSNVAKCVFYTATEMVETDKSVICTSNVMFNFLIMTHSEIIESLPNRWKLAILAFKYIDLAAHTFEQDFKQALCISWDNHDGGMLEQTQRELVSLTTLEAENKFLYDIFLCCCENDREMAVKDLASKLEQLGYRLCLPWRNFVLGIQKADNIQIAILESQCTMILFSNAFNGDPISLWQLDCAIAEARRRERQIIGVITKNLDRKMLSHKAQTFLNCTTCLELESEFFWKRIRFCLSCEVDGNSNNSCTETGSPFYILPTLARKWKLFNWADQSKTYDAFISYCWYDSEFITEHLVPKLKSHGLRACLDREVFPRGLLLSAISKSVNLSKRVIVYLTPRWTLGKSRITLLYII